ncbi:zinc finger protein 596-like isoform X2 [Nilaparvata lugens]|nr:zinc finger protein 596-like isoform X2 [Nilaparvata lugens]XP_039284593.1 zinc finger protein 596-like isoform X2 [Nilaparvata lugens]
MDFEDYSNGESDSDDYLPASEVIICETVYDSKKAIMDWNKQPMARWVEHENEVCQKPTSECSTACSPNDNEKEQTVLGYRQIFIKQEQNDFQDAEENWENLDCNTVEVIPDMRTFNCSTSGHFNGSSIEKDATTLFTEPKQVLNKVKKATLHCSDSFRRLSHLKLQIRKHKKPSNCEFCDYKTTNSSNLKRHVRTHIGVKPVQSVSCTFCDKKFSGSATLRNHLKKHSAEMRFSCELCDYKCNELVTLNTHIGTHNMDKKPFCCELCDYKFSRSGHLRRHMRTHTGEKPYSCKLCDFRCAQIGSIQYHFRKHHEDEDYSKLYVYKYATN